MGALAVATLSLAIEALVFRWSYQKMFQSMIGLLGLNMALMFSSVIIWDIHERSISPAFNKVLKLGGLTLAGDRLVVIGIAVVALAAFWLLMTRTRYGIAMRATADDARSPRRRVSTRARFIASPFLLPSSWRHAYLGI